MHIVTLLGSPRRKGNTATVLAAFEQKLSPFHTIERIDLVDYTIRGCLGCDYCQRHADQPFCAQQDDDANAVFERMRRADLLVYASPLYVWDFTAQMKTLLDRQYCLIKWRGGQVYTSFLAGKSAILLVTCGAGIEDNADVIQVVFKREMDCAGCQVAGIYILPNCTTPRAIGSRMDPLVAAMAVPWLVKPAQ